MQKMRSSTAFAAALAAGLSAPTQADFYAAVATRSYVTAVDFGGVVVGAHVVDVYLLSDDPNDTLLNVYNWNTMCGASTSYFQSFTGTGWIPTNLGGPFDTEALRCIDSFVTIGGFDLSVIPPKQTPGSGSGSGLDPNFGGNSAAAPDADAGWYNGSPPSYNGEVQPIAALGGQLGVLIGRFSSFEAFSLHGTTFAVTWNQGLGTPGEQAGFSILDITDCNANGVPDGDDYKSGNSQDVNGNCVPDECEIGDCDKNGIDDLDEIDQDPSLDCDGSGTLDTCDLDGGLAEDCNTNGLIDTCEILDGTATDCNANWVLDECDIAAGTSTDYDADGVPDECEGGIVGTDYATIAEAMLGVPDGGVIVVPDGIWGEQVVFDRPVLLIAPDGATILPKAQGPAIIADGAPVGATMVGFTIRGGSPSTASPLGGGIVGTDSAIRLDGCIIRNNTGADGGGARFLGGSPTIVDCSFLNNTSTGRGGGLRLIGCDAMVSNCSFEMNQALGASGFAIAATDGFPTFTDLEVAFHSGQPLVFEEATNFPATQMTLDRLYVHDNGGNPLLFETDDSEFCTLSDSRICGNDGEPTIGPFAWGGENIIFFDRCPDLVVPDDAQTIQLAIDTAQDGDRIAIRPGTWDEGGLSITGAGFDLVGVNDPFLEKPVVIGPIVVADTPGPGLLRRLSIRDGHGSTSVPGYEGVAVGGGVAAVDSDLTIDDCDLSGNEASLGGGIFASGGRLLIENSVIASNLATIGGGGIHLQGSAATTVEFRGAVVGTNVVPTDGTARGGGVDAQGLASSASLSIANTTITGNTLENIVGGFVDEGGNAIWTAQDCNGNGIEDIAETLDLGGPDCNGNLVPDDCDLARGTSADCDGDGQPDDCRLGYDHTLRYKSHDGVADNGFGAGEPGTLAWIQRFVAAPGLTTIREVGVEFALPWSGPAYNGLPVTVGVWSDPDGDGRPYDAVPLALVDIVIVNAPAAARQFATLPSRVSFSPGDSFFVGAIMDRPQGPHYPASTDTSGGSTDSWFAFDSAFFEPDAIGTASEIGTLPSLGFNWRWMITAVPEYDARSEDCNANGVIDSCDVVDGTSGDCDGNGLPDECELADGAPDLDQDGVLDVCQDQLVFSVPDRFPTLGGAIDAATDGSRIQLAPGSYVGPFDLGVKNLEIIGDPADPATTTLETPGLNATVLRIAGGQDATTIIAGVTIENGVADSTDPGNPTLLVGGGVFIDASSPVLEDCIIGTNSAARGGGLYLRDSSAVLRRLRIEGNGADAGGGGLWWSGGVAFLEDCTVRDNQSGANGGGMRLATDGGAITGGSITGNLATDDGAGLWWQGSTETLDLSSLFITGNVAGGEGGGVLAQHDAPGVSFTDSTVCDNTPDEIVGPYVDLGGNDLCVCPFDLSGNGEVGAEDVGILLSQWGPCPSGCSADFNGDGEVRAADLGPLLGAWGVCP